jgi:branched-chain amino acid transport system substrate-binding protein
LANNIHERGLPALPQDALNQDMYLLEVKTPYEFTEPWDTFKIVARIPGEGAFRTASEGACVVKN